MSLNMKSLTQALAKTAAVIEKTVQSTVHEVTGPKPMQDYELQEQIGSAGPALAWKLYSASPRSKTPQQHQEVCVWVLDKKAVGEARQRSGLPKASEEAFLDILRSDAAKLARLRHPGVVQVVQGLDESKAAMAMVTEPIFACLANLLSQTDNLPNLPKHLNGLELGRLEIKHGLLQLSESLNFLHNNARTIHSAVSPESVFITASGAWKLGGFGFATSIDQMTSEVPRGPTFHYPEYDADDALLPLQPPLNYTAPELTRRNGSATRTSADTFSLACLAYCLLAKRPLIESNNNLKTYTRKLTYLTNEDFVNIPPELVPDMRRMLNMDEMSRPSVLDFTGSSYFRDDTRLRALRFLDHMLERDNMQKSEFLKALTSMWTEFDARVLRYRVLPPLCAELRNLVLQPMILPMVLTIAEAQDKSDFESSTFPALVPVLTTASGDSLLLLVKHAALLINKVGPEQLTSCVLPMLVRAYDDTDARMQEEVLRRTLSIAKILDFQVLREAILPRLHNLALRTTVAAVRVNALLCFAELVQRLDKEAVLEILQTVQRCTAVDHSAPTLMCTLDVANAINKQYGVEFSAQRLLPLLSPLLVTQQLNVQQFAKYMHFIKDILRQIEDKRGITANGDGSTSVDLKMQNTLVNESTKTVSRKESSNTMLSSVAASGNGNGNGNGNSSWDSDDLDWAAIAKSQKVSATDVAAVSNIGPGTQQVSSIFGNGPSNSGATVASVSFPSDNIGGNYSTYQWPLPSSSAIPKSTPYLDQQSLSWAQNSSSHDLGSKGMEASSLSAKPGGGIQLDSSFDPFADWPPRNASTGGSYTSSGGMSQPSLAQARLNTSSGQDVAQVSLRQQKEMNLAELFPSARPQSTSAPLKLAPPPIGSAAPLGLGKGRGRNPIHLRPTQSPKKSNSATSNAPPPPLLDLL